VDSEKALGLFFQLCHAAGPDGCAYYASSPSEIESNFNQLAQDLSARPVPFITRASDNSSTGAGPPLTYGVINWNDLRRTTFNNLYAPWQAWTPFAAALAQLQEYIKTRNDSSPSFSIDPQIAPLLGAPPTIPTCAETCGCSAEGNGTTEGKSYPDLRDYFLTVACNDWPRSDPGFDSFKREFAAAEQVSEFGGAWYSYKAWCSYVSLLLNQSFFRKLTKIRYD
jgi:hypothetical protein